MPSYKKLMSFRPLTQLLGFLLTFIGLLSGYDALSVIFLALSIFMGPVFCGWICPFGALQDWSRALGRRLGLRAKRLPRKLHNLLLPLRYIFLAASTLVGIDFIFTLLSYDPRVNLSTLINGHRVATLGLVVIGLFLLLALVFERPFCQYGCIEGAKQGLFSTLRPLTIVRNTDSCINCGLCNRSCPMQVDIMNHPSVRSLQCTTCLTCVAKCPVDNTLTLARQPLRPLKLSPKYGLILLLSLSLLAYLGYNNYSLSQLSTATNQAYSMATETTENQSPSPTNVAATDESNELTAPNANLIPTLATGVADGFYEGSGTGFRGTLTLSVEVVDEQVVNLSVVTSREDARWFNRAWNTLSTLILEDQSVEVDNVTGATYSANAIKEAVANAMIEAGSLMTSEPDSVQSPSIQPSLTEDQPKTDSTSEDKESLTTSGLEEASINPNAAVGLEDGLYEGQGIGFKGTIVAQITIEAERIVAIDILQQQDDERWFTQAYNLVTQLILSEQSPEVDDVTGATYSSSGIRQAVADALIQAGSTSTQAIESLPGAGEGRRGKGRGHH